LPINNETHLEATLNNWQVMSLAEKPTVIEKFTAGLNHQTYLISSANKKYVLKLFSQRASRAILAQKITSKKNLSPEILYTNKNEDVMLMDYISTESSYDNTNITSLAQTIKEVHALSYRNIDTDFGKFDLLAFITQYRNEIGQTDIPVNNLHHQLLPIVDLYLNDPTPWCFCHNDLVVENCLLSQNENPNTIIIDWEYAQINNPWFDIASVVHHFKLNEQQSAHLIQNYQPELAKQINSAIYFSAQCVVLWLDLLWYMAKKSISPTEQKHKLRRLKLQINNYHKHSI